MGISEKSIEHLYKFIKRFLLKYNYDLNIFKKMSQTPTPSLLNPSPPPSHSPLPLSASSPLNPPPPLNNVVH
jgi:hypothetical protein